MIPRVGIDLGTTYSCVAIYLNGQVKVIENENGNKTTPSYVRFNEDGSVVVGETASEQSFRYPESTIFESHWSKMWGSCGGGESNSVALPSPPSRRKLTEDLCPSWGSNENHGPRRSLSSRSEEKEEDPGRLFGKTRQELCHHRPCPIQ